ncbi:MAG TPA: hypothetical protein VFE62_24935 [Gemmataceae bacterium]|nr:hypothetical protein [Gemmataceae bacterium]
MQKPICTEPITAFSFTIQEHDRPVPVSVAGYRLREGRQYCLHVKARNPLIKIQNVTLQTDDSVEVYDGNVTEDGGFLRRFKVIDNSWWSFLPFRFLTNATTLRAEIDVAEGGSRTIRVPVIAFHFLPAFTNLQWLWYLCGGAAVFGLPYLLSLIEADVSPTLVRLVLFLSLMVVAPVIAFALQYRILRRRAKELRKELLIDPDDDDECAPEEPE